MFTRQRYVAGDLTEQSLSLSLSLSRVEQSERFYLSEHLSPSLSLSLLSSPSLFLRISNYLYRYARPPLDPWTRHNHDAVGEVG